MARRFAGVLDAVEAILIALVFATFAKTFVVQAFKIPSGSMEQNLLVGDHILVNKFIYGPSPTALERKLLPVRPLERGDVTVFKFPQDPSRDFIKRCVALPGDRVELVDKRLFVNETEVDESRYTLFTDPRVYPASRFLPESRRFRDNYGPYLVPAAGYFCLGDNRDNSNDSRVWESVPQGFVRGRAFMIYWSLEPAEMVGIEESSVFGRIWERIRWDRSFRVVR
ncbi:MAG: signal peptidase I [Acidobacteriota bacterium]